MADEAKAISTQHQKWIVETLKKNNGECTYEVIVKVGEEKECDTVGAMLKVLKSKKVIHFDQQFLMYPMNKDDKIKLLLPDYEWS